MESIKFYSASEMDEVFGWNPVTDSDSESLNIDDDSIYVADLRNRLFDIVVGNQSFGSIEMDKEDFKKALELFGQELIQKIQQSKEIAEDDKRLSLTFVETDTTLTMYFITSSSFTNEEGDDLLANGATFIESMMMDYAGCDGALVGTPYYAGCNGALVGTPYNDGDGKGLYFEFTLYPN